MNTIMTSLSRVTTTLRQYTYPIAVGCLFAFTQFMPAVNAQTTSDFEEMPVLTEEDFDLPDSGRYLVKLNPISADEPMIKPSEDMESGVSLGAVEEDLKAALKNYPEATITPLMAGNSVADAQALSSNDSPLANVYVVEVSSDVDPEAFIDELSSYPFVEYAEQDGVAFATDITPNDPYFRYQWGLQNIKAPEAWQCTGKEDEIVIAVLDTGVYYYHEDLSGKVIRGYDFAENDPYPYDRHGHGTHVSGIAAAKTNNGRGIAGVCRDCKVLAVKVLNDWGWGYYSWIANGIIYAVQHGADVINMSLGGGGYSWTLRNAVRYAHDAGVTIVASAGNSYCYSYYYSTVGYPAKFPETIAVAATTSSNSRAYFSSCGPELDISAPGYSIVSTIPYNRYAWWSGTSMAAPHVAGAVGVLLAIKPDLSPEQVRQYLQDTAQYLGSWRYYGAGLLDMPDLLKEVAIWGTEGTDYLMGSYQDDVICGLGGDDQIFGFEGDDLLLGGPGQDTIYGNEGNDFIVGGSGYDFIWGGMGEDFCYDKKDSRNDCEYH